MTNNRTIDSIAPIPTTARVAAIAAFLVATIFCCPLARGQNVKATEPNRGGTLDLASMDADKAVEFLRPADGFEISLFASEKDFPLHNPVSLAFDARGRLWVLTMPSYPHYLPGEQPNDKLIVLEDTDGDGRADKHTVFADKLYVPTGFEIGDGGAYIAAQPSLIFARDTNGDDVADERVTLLHGFGTEDSHHSISAFTWGPGGALYMHEGIFLNSQVETPYGPVRLRNAGIFRYRPKIHRLEVFVSYPFSNPWGHVFDYWGQNFIADASGGRNHYGLPITGHVDHPRKHPRVRVLTAIVRPSAGCEIVSSRQFPESAQGNFLVNNCIGFQGIKQHRLIEDGSGFTAEEVEPLVYSSDINFRPVDLQFGPDGALYLVDWFNPLIGHMQYSLRDERRDHHHGRIWRVTYKGKPLLTPPKIAGEPIPALLDLLRTYEDRTRYRARRELRDRPRAEVATAVDEWVAGLDPTEKNYEHHLLEALWVCQTVHVVKPELLPKLLRARDYHARAAATRVLRYWREQVEHSLGWLKIQVGDEHPRVRLEAVVALSHFRSEEAVTIALEALNHPMDYYLEYGLQETIATLEPYWKPILAAGKPFAADHPEGLRYLVDRLPTAELRKLPLSEPVYAALLTRHDLSHDARAASLKALSELRGTNLLTETLTAIDEVDRRAGVHTAHVLRELSHGLRAVQRESLTAKRPAFEQLSRGGRHAITRKIGYAAWVQSDDSTDAAWTTAAASVTSLRDFLGAVPLIENVSLRESLYPQIKLLLTAAADTASVPAIENAGNEALVSMRHDAMEALVSIEGRESESFAVLASFVATGEYSEAAVRALRRLPKESWAADRAPTLLEAALSFLQTVPADKLNTPAAQDAVAFGRDLASLLAADARELALFELDAFGVNVILIRAVPHKMVYDRTKFFVEAGKPVEIIFENSDIMPHNLLLTAPGAMAEVGQAAERMATQPDAFERNFVPDSSKVLYATKMIAPGQVQSLTFAAPGETGNYPYVCTFPGHWRTMNGTMEVVANLREHRDAQLAAERAITKVEARAFVREWKAPEVVALLPRSQNGRSHERGQQMFKALACSQCHKVKGEGGVIGPDLTELTKRLKPEEIVRELVEPSKVITEKFGSHVIVTTDGRVVTGIILSQDEKALRIADNPLTQFKPTEIQLSAIALKEAAKVSLMPAGLLNTLSEDELLDLLAFVQAGGDAGHAVFRKN